MELTDQTQDVAIDYLDRIQRSINAVVDRELVSLHSKLNEQGEQMMCQQKAREELASALTGAKINISKMNELIADLNAKLQREEHTKKRLAREQSRLLEESARQSKSLVDADEELKRTKLELESAKLKLSQLTDLNLAFHSNVKVQKQMNNKIEKEMSAEESARRMAEKNADVYRRKLEKALEEYREIRNALENQQRETDALKSNAKGLANELEKVRTEKAKLEKQWEEAIVAMTRRDETLEKVHRSHEEIKTHNNELAAENRFSKTEHDRLKLEVENLNGSKKVLEKTLSDNVEQLARYERQNRELQDAVDSLRNTEGHGRHEIVRLQKSNEVLKQDLMRRDNLIKGLQIKLQEEKRNHSSADGAFLQDDQITNELLEKARRDKFASEVRLRGEQTVLKSELVEVSQQLKLVAAENELVSNKHREVEKKAVDGEDKIRRLEYDLQRKEHDVNMWKTKYEGLKKSGSDIAYQHQIDLEKLQRQVEGMHAENERLQRLWLNSQKELLQGRAMIKQQAENNNFKQTRLHVADIKKEAMERELKKLREEGLDERSSVNRLWMELSKLKPIVEELKQKNAELGLELADKTSQLEMSQLNSKTSYGMLRSHIHQITADHTDAKKNKDLADRAMDALRRKYSYVKEIADQCKSENQQLKVANFQLNDALALLHKKHDGLKLQFRKWTESAARLMDLRNSNKGGENLTLPKISEHSGNDESSDIAALKYRLVSLDKEKDFLSQDNVLLKARVDDLLNKVSELTRQLKKVHDSNHSLRTDVDSAQTYVKRLIRRCILVERVACHLESVYRDMLPNGKLDYRVALTECQREPSPQLLGLLTWQKDINGLELEETRLMAELRLNAKN